ncbi:MAG: class I SAM-dependent methyltransferase [Chloroflexi bacterium]|nr:class I SAM-dependent methyltransferase [Chloroflexota bacterium]MCI0726759.1 class I SAM-dependent methyltransferase [Chloroflexota bacterium]
MEIIRGKKTLVMDASALAERLRGYEHILLDIGTGDGRFVRHVAETWPGTFALGIDACRENLRDASRKAPGNALYLIANASALPAELHGLATHVTINFPWGSLLAGLLAADQGLMRGLAAVAQPGARIEVRLNGGALSEAGWSLEAGAARVRQVLLDAGFEIERPVAMGAAELRRLPTTWAKRLAFGRDPRGIVLSGSWGGVGGAPFYWPALKCIRLGV